MNLNSTRIRGRIRGDNAFILLLGYLALAVIIITNTSCTLHTLQNSPSSKANSPSEQSNQSNQSNHLQPLYNTYGRALEVGVIVYEESLRAAGAAHARGSITDEQLDQIRTVGVHVQASLDLAKTALLHAAQYGSLAGTDDVSHKFIAAQESITFLLRVLGEMGVTSSGAPAAKR